MSRSFWKRFIGAWFIAIFSLQLTRLVFFLNLRNYFDSSFSELGASFVAGFGFDAVSMAYLLGPFFVSMPFLRSGKQQKIAQWYFIVMLGAMNLLNCIDAEFFKFTSRRSTFDLFEFAFLSNDLFNIAPNLLSYFWYLLAAFLLTMFLALWLFSKLPEPESAGTSRHRGLLLIPILLLLVLAARGGFRPRPLSIVDAAHARSPHLNAVVLSTPFTMIKTFGKPELRRFSFPAEELTPLSPIVGPSASPFAGKMRGQNVVVIIVESLATEYVGALNGLGKGYTPFVDSLCGVSMVFDNGFANGHRSIEGIPAVVASIPTLMYEPYTTSAFASNRISSMANLLREKGYFTSFMHGGNRNSMNFESFAAQAGYNIFYDRDDYPFPDEHYDGFWGISDHCFLNHCVEKFSEYERPFFSTIFTLSSHHPYSIPKEYQGKYPKGTLPIHESLGYADEALRQFFRKASQTDWYQHTLFVITADHTSLSEHPQFQTKLGSLRIPILFFHPTDRLISGRRSQVMQQIDIMPTTLGLLGHGEPYFSFGKDVFDEQTDQVAVAFKHDQFQLLRNGQLICFDGERTTFVYDVNSDPWLRNNLRNGQNTSFAENEAYLKTYIQHYSTALNYNRMTANTWAEKQP